MNDPLTPRPRHSNSTALAGSLFIGLLIMLTARSAFFDMGAPTSYFVAGFLVLVGIAVPGALMYHHRKDIV